MSNGLFTLVLFTLAGGAFAATFLSDPCPSPCGTAATVSTTAVWSGGSDTGGCTPEEMGHRPIPGMCSEKGCSLAATNPSDNGTCEPSDPADSKDCGDAHHSNDSKAACREVGGDEQQDRRSGCIPPLLPPPSPRPWVSLACYQDDRGDGPNSQWGNAYKPLDGYPSHDRCYDSSGDQLGHDDLGPCFDRWGNFIGVKTPYNPALI